MIVEIEPQSDKRFTLRERFLRSDGMRGYLLLSPTLLIVAGIMIVPFLGLIVLSLWTQTGYNKFDTTLTLDNFVWAFSNEMYRALFNRSVIVSGLTTLFTVALAYPMAYFVAFHVHRRKLLWIILMTLPFWTSYLLRVFVWNWLVYTSPSPRDA